MIKSIYIAGPITDNPQYETEFEIAEEAIAGAGFVPLSPVWLSDFVTEWQFEHGTCMELSRVLLTHADAAVFLQGWECSSGALEEMGFCVAFGKPTYQLSGMPDAEEIKSAVEKMLKDNV